MAFGVGVGFDRERALGELSSQVLEVEPPRFLQLFESLAVLLDHPKVVLRGEGRQALRNQIVASETRPDLDEVARLAERGDRLGQDQVNVAVLGTTGVVLSALDPRLPGRPRGLVGFRLARVTGLGLAFRLRCRSRGFGFAGLWFRSSWP